MGLLFSAIATIIIGLTLAVNPGKLVKDIQAKTITNANVTANTTTNGSIGVNNGTTNIGVETDDKLETNTTANVTEDKDENSEEKDKDRGKAENHEKVSAFNNRSGKVMKALIPKVAVDHSGSLDVSGNETVEVGKEK